MQTTTAGQPGRRQEHVIGLVGGLSWQSTALYYRLVNEGMERALGGHNNAECIVVTVNFETVLAAGLAGEWDTVAAILIDASRTLEAAGCGCVLLTANTAHRVADQVQDAIGCPLLHIADVTARAVSAAGVSRPVLFGTLPMMDSGLFQERLTGCDVRLPGEADRETLNRIILEELTAGQVTREARTFCTDLAEGMMGEGADSLIIGCTELPLIFDDLDLAVPSFDSTRLHAEAGIEFALGEHAALGARGDT